MILQIYYNAIQLLIREAIHKFKLYIDMNLFFQIIVDLNITVSMFLIRHDRNKKQIFVSTSRSQTLLTLFIYAIIYSESVLKPFKSRQLKVCVLKGLQQRINRVVKGLINEIQSVNNFQIIFYVLLTNVACNYLLKAFLETIIYVLFNTFSGVILVVVFKFTRENHKVYFHFLAS